ncbi:hypothetical protein C0995_013051, partial [Termitomyces sp. Mi166
DGRRSTITRQVLDALIVDFSKDVQGHRWAVELLFQVDHAIGIGMIDPVQQDVIV